MIPLIGASLISAGGSIIGGLLGKSSADKANAQNARYMDQQYQLALNSISNRVADAKNAGIHPLYALGAPTMSSAVVASQPDNSLGNAVAQAGQSIGDIYRRADMDRLQKHLVSSQISMYDQKAVGQGIENQKALLELEKMKSSINKGQTQARSPGGITVAGEKISKNKGWSDAQDIEDRYGDIVSWLYGIGVIGADFKKNIDDRWRKMPPAKKKKALKKALNVKSYLTNPYY